MANHGRFFQPPWADYPCLSVSKRTKDVIALLRRRAVRAISIEDWEDPSQSLDFLTEGDSQLIHLWINTGKVPDLSPVSGLFNLEKLVLAPNTVQQQLLTHQVAGIDFSRLIRLRECVLANVESLGNLPACQRLEELMLINCRLSNLRVLSPMAALTRLHLRDIQLQSLTGIEQLTALRTLTLSQVSLATLGAVEEVAARFPGVEIRQLPIRARGAARFDLDEIEEQQTYELRSNTSSPSYVQRVDPDHPGCLMVLIDQSGSMASEFGALPKSTKAKDVAQALNRFLQHVATCCYEAGQVRDYWYVGMIGYGNTVGSAFGGSLAGRTIVPISELVQQPLRFESRKKPQEDGDGEGLEIWKALHPVWITPIADGDTRMRRAFALTQDVLRSWLMDHPSAFPPIVVNITDAQGTDGDFGSEVRTLKRLRTEDGEVLFFNIVMEARSAGEEAIAFPSQWDEWGRTLFRFSSRLPTCMLTAAKEVGYDVSETSRGFLERAMVEDIVSALSLFTAAAGFAENRKRGLLTAAERNGTKELIHSESCPASSDRVTVAAKKLRQLLGETLTAELFWKIIETSRRLAPDDLEEQQQALQRLLQVCTPNEIVQFDWHFCQYLAQACTWDLWGAAYIIGNGCSDDGFMDFRAWLIAKGKRVYENALRDPETLLRVMKESDGNGQFEGFQYVAMDVWEGKTGKSQDDFPGHEQQVAIAGEPWQESGDDLRRRFPKLWKKFAVDKR